MVNSSSVVVKNGPDEIIGGFMKDVKLKKGQLRYKVSLVSLKNLFFQFVSYERGSKLQKEYHGSY